MSVKHFLRDSEKILVQKNGNKICVLSRFSPDKNVFTLFNEGNHLRYFLPPDAPFENGMAGECFHAGWDDFAPFVCEKYGTIGANHGSPFTYRVSTLRHWLTDCDIGRILIDDAGNCFVITDIKNVSEYLIHSEAEKCGNSIRFKHLCGNLYLDGVKVDAVVKQEQYSTRNGLQLAPHQRYNAVTLFADGKIIADGEICECSSAVLELDIDFCPPDALLDYVAAHPGQYTSPVAPELPALLNNLLHIEFQPFCAYTVDAQITVLQDRDETFLYSLMQSYNELQLPVQKKFIPGIRPFPASDGENIADLNYGVTLSPEVYQRTVVKADCINPAKLPNEYIDLWGNGDQWLWGEVIGFSRKYGITRRSAENLRSNEVCLLYKTGKNYPYVLRCDTLRKGSQYHIVAYRQFFDPAQSFAVSCYGHRERGVYTHYCNYPASGRDMLKLPRSLAGKKIIVEENSCGAVVPETVPSDGAVPVDVASCGALVFCAE